jgi:hypothetical protein
MRRGLAVPHAQGMTMLSAEVPEYDVVFAVGPSRFAHSLEGA